MNELTNKQDVILKYILKCYKAGWLPTLGDIAGAFRLSQRSGAVVHVNALIEKGWLIRRTRGKSGVRLSRKSLKSM